MGLEHKSGSSPICLIFTKRSTMYWHKIEKINRNIGVLSPREFILSKFMSRQGKRRREYLRIVKTFDAVSAERRPRKPVVVRIHHAYPSEN